mmetsp:Transcript_17350/g.49681  ORF Transcript_17350/g.49681 Transcript_17350/m.49681 type:complete len:324 (-) Transcript_17350:750-1721(-)
MSALLLSRNVARIGVQVVRIGDTCSPTHKHGRSLLRQNFSSSSLASKASTDTVTDTSNEVPNITLYQYAICPFCHKAKALLSYVGIEPSRTIEVNPLTKAELPNGDYRKVPIAIVDDQQVNGSDDIVQALLDHGYIESTLESRWKEGELESGEGESESEAPQGIIGKMTMDSFRSSDNSQRWADFASNDLAGLMYPNICRTLSDSFAAFGYVDSVSTFSPIQKGMIKGVGSLAMYMAASKIKKKRNIDDEQEALREAIRKWEQEGLDGGNKSFGSGQSQPDLGDISVYGTLRSVQGLPAFDMALATSQVVKEWYERMEKEMKS